MNAQVPPAETSEILRLATSCLEISGDFVELGCYRGDTSVLLGKLLQKHATCGKPVDNLCRNTNDIVEKQCKTSPNKPESVSSTPVKRLWIYDSFAGLPDKTLEDSSGAGQNFQAGELFVTKREVIAKIRKNNLHNIIVKKAWFNDLTDKDLPSEIAFAFCDGDLYSSIKTSLKLVAPRLAQRGTIIVHDYNNPELPGSARAVDEFLHSHPNFQLKVRHTLAILQLK